jgi:O-antigen/teichoic acid export membrane protein
VHSPGPADAPVGGDRELTMDSVFKPTLLLMAGRTLAFGGTFLIPVVLTRVFEPAEFGTYKQLMLLYSTLYAVVPFGMAESLYYFLPREPRRAGVYLANTLLFLAAALSALMWVGLALRLAGPRGAAAEHVFGLAVFAGVMLLSAPLEIVMVARSEYTAAARAYAVSDLARAALFAIPALLTGRLEWLIAGAVAFAALRLAFTLAYVSARERLRPDLAALRTQLAYALPFGGAAVLEIAQATFHQYAVSYQYSAAAFAVYSVGCLQIPLVDFLAGPAGNVMMVRLGQREPDREGALRLWHDMTRRLALVFVPLVVLLQVLAFDVIVLLFTPLYAGSVPIFRWWCLTILLAALQTDAVLRVHAQTRFLFALNLVRLALIASTIVPALRLFGLPGAAVVTVATLAVTKGLALARVQPLLQTSLATLLPWSGLLKIAAAAFVAAAPTLLVRTGTHDATLTRIAAVAVVYGATYVALAAAALLTDDERRAVGAFFGRPLQWLAAERAAARS